jgi:hypothetical protein
MPYFTKDYFIKVGFVFKMNYRSLYFNHILIKWSRATMVHQVH